MHPFRLTPRALFATAVAAVIGGGSAAPAIAQPALARTPNVEGTWVTPGGTAYFAFLHRFTVGAAPTYTVGNIPTFHLSAGFLDWLSVGALYATETVTVPGASQELEVWAKQRFLDEAAGAPCSLSLKEAFNTTAFSPDAELSASKLWGPLGLTAAVRALGNFQYAGTPRVVGALGASWRLTPYLAIAADAAASPMRAAAEPPVAWGAGVQMQIPYSPHTLSLQATNTGTDSIHGASVATPNIRYGFDFTIPFSNAQQWLDIFRPAAAAAAPTTTPAPAQTPVPAPSAAAGKPSAAPGPDLAKAKAFYTQRCAGCHGGVGQGGFGPDLRPSETKGDEFIAERIRKGSPKGMPGFEQALTAGELQALVAYVKSL